MTAVQLHASVYAEQRFNNYSPRVLEKKFERPDHSHSRVLAVNHRERTCIPTRVLCKRVYPMRKRAASILYSQSGPRATM